MSIEIQAILTNGNRGTVDGRVFELMTPTHKGPHLKEIIEKKHFYIDLRIVKHEFTCNRIASGLILTTLKEVKAEVLEGYVNNMQEDDVMLSVNLISHIQRNYPEGTLKNVRQGVWAWSFIPNWEFSIK